MSQLYFSKDKINQSYLGKNEVKTPTFKELIPNYLSYEWDTSKQAESSVRINDTTFTFTESPVFVTMDDLGIKDVTSFHSMFGFYLGGNNPKGAGITKLEQLPQSSKVKHFGNMFRYQSGLTSVDLRKMDTSSANYLTYMFSGSSNIEEVNISGWDTSNVTNINGCFGGLTDVKELDVSSWNTSKVTTCVKLFEGCISLESLDLSSWDMSNVTVSQNMTNMFSNCSSLRELKYFKKVSNLSDWTITSLGLTSLAKLDVTALDTSEMTSLAAFFNGCRNLTSLDVSNFNTSNVTDMYKMFADCSSLGLLDLSGWDTSNVTNIQFMMADCTDLYKVDLSGWDLTNCSNTIMPFNNCPALTEIYMRGCNQDTIDKIKKYAPASATIITE